VDQHDQTVEREAAAVEISAPSESFANTTSVDSGRGPALVKKPVHAENSPAVPPAAAAASSAASATAETAHLERWWILAGPIPDATVPVSWASRKELSPVMLHRKVSTEARELASIDVIAPDAAAPIVEALRGQGLPVRTDAVTGGVRIIVGPLTDAAAADMAAVAMVSQGYPAQSRSVKIERQSHYLKLGPIVARSTAEQVAREIQDSLGLRAGLLSDEPTQP
jgi:hypothetical protein